MRLRKPGCSTYMALAFSFALLLCLHIFTAAYGEQVSLCDYWPLAVGNSWTAYDSGVFESITVEEAFDVSGVTVWRVTETYDFGINTLYYAYVDGWLCKTNDYDNVASLPAGSGNWTHIAPETITIDEPFALPGFSTPIVPRRGALLSLIPQTSWVYYKLVQEGDHPDTLVLLAISGSQIYMSFSRGMGILSQVSTVYTDMTVVSGCSPALTICEWPRGGWFEAGAPMHLTAGVTGKADGFTYQWIKDETLLAGATDEALDIPSLTEEDAGQYSCVISDGSGSVRTPSGTVTVFAPGSLPLNPALAATALSALVSIIGIRRINRRRR